MLDVLLKNGHVVDGTGRAAESGDVGIRDGRIVAVGQVDEAAARVIDVDGAVVSPGFVDLHTHYDAQIFWDPTLASSSMHGVTTVFAGNCGLNLAPCATDEDRDFLRRLLARVEAIPVEALEAGVDFGWKSFPEFLDAVDASRPGVNIGFLVGHSAIRRAVMGSAASEREATPDEIAAMRRTMSEAMAAGGFGFSSSNVITQKDGDGRPTPPNFATREEFMALAEVCGEHPGTTIEFIPASFLRGFTDEDVELMADMSAIANRPLNWSVLLINSAVPDLHTRQLRTIEAGTARGGRVFPLFLPANPPSRRDFLHPLPFGSIKDWGWLFELEGDARVKALTDPANRERLRVSIEADPMIGANFRSTWGLNYVNDIKGDHLQDLVGRRIDSIAAERGISDFDAVLDIVVAGELEVGFVRHPFDGDDPWLASERAGVLHDQRVVFGGSDAGAHMDLMVGGDFTTRTLGELVRDKGILSLEEAIHRLADVPAQRYGLTDRGRLVPGARADIVVFDLDSLAAGPLQPSNDLPAGAPRLTTTAAGVHRVMVGGQDVVVDGQLTGERPGTVLRSGRDSSTVLARPEG